MPSLSKADYSLHSLKDEGVYEINQSDTDTKKIK